MCKIQRKTQAGALRKHDTFVIRVVIKHAKYQLSASPRALFRHLFVMMVLINTQTVKITANRTSIIRKKVGSMNVTP